MSLNRQTLSAPSVGGGGSTGPYVTIYENASVTPQAALWTIVDGRVTQVGLDVRATTGTTAITTGQGLTFDGDFDLSPIGATLATFSSTNCVYGDFAPGTLANLSSLYFSGCTFTTFDISGIQNQCGLSLVGCTIPSLTLTPAAIYNVVILQGVYGNMVFTGCPNLNTISINSDSPPTFGSIGCGDITVANSTTLTGVTIGGSTATYGNVSITGCTALQFVNLYSNSLSPAIPSFLSLNFSNCTAVTEISTFAGYEISTPSLNVSGCSALATLSVPSATLTTVTMTTLPAATTVGLQGCALNVASVNAILVALDANGLSGGAVYLDLGTNAAPTGAGITAKNNLIAKGWTVATN
jgi:hypothetical protein